MIVLEIIGAIVLLTLLAIGIGTVLKRATQRAIAQSEEKKDENDVKP